MIFWKRWQFNRLLKKAKREIDNREQGKQSHVQDEILIQMKLAKFYLAYHGSASFPFAKDQAYECYRYAANLGSIEAQYLFGEYKLEQGKFWHQYTQSPYGRPLHEIYAKACFDEAFNYLEKAKEGDHAKAVQLLGMAYIQGWGVAMDKEKGFQLIVDSIELEGSWDKAPEIFKKLGLNNPEFFSMLAKRRASG